MSSIETVRLKSGLAMPRLGLGTWRLSGDACVSSVKKAIELGYRHIDTAERYNNHRQVGKAIKGYDRSQLFITTKVWRTDLAYGKVLRACDRALREIGTEYIDLYLVHWPSGSIPIDETMRAMKKLVQDNKVRSVGVSNFYGSELRKALSSNAAVSVDQIEFHPYLYQRDTLELCKDNGLVVTAYSPLARGECLTDPVIKEIAGKHGKSPAQVCLRWLVQHGLAVIPKSESEQHMRENMGIFGFRLAKNEMEAIDSLRISRRLVNPAFTKIPFFGRIPKKAMKFAGRFVR